MRSRPSLLFAFLAAFAVFFVISWHLMRTAQSGQSADANASAQLASPPVEVTNIPPVVQANANVDVNAAPVMPTPAPAQKPAQDAPLGEPLTDALARVTKKFFGTYVTPQNSPVQPEHFTGYHTGVDFETTPAEQDIDVPVSVICDGALALKEYASGYGGVAVQRCTLDGGPVTVIYGHLKLASITTAVGTVMKRGDRLGVLGKGYSSETDGERKHLHLGIHVGKSIDIRGYGQTKAALAGWLDATSYMR